MYSIECIKGGCNSSFWRKMLLDALPHRGWGYWGGPWVYINGPGPRRRWRSHLRPESKTEILEATESSSEGLPETVCQGHPMCC